MLQALVAVLVLGILVFVHELGHFLLAKWNNVGVLDFAIGFGKVLWSKKIGETTYSIRLIPLGGYVRMVGDDPFDNAEQLTSAELAALDSSDPRKSFDRSRWFLSKGYWAKAAIVVAGPAFNIIFAILVSVASFAAYGKLKSLDMPVIGDLIPGYPAEKAGLKPKDKVISVNGVAIDSWVALAKTVAASEGAALQLEVERPASGLEQQAQKLSMRLTGTNDTAELAILEGNSNKRPFKLGIVPDSERVAVGLGEAIVTGTEHVLFLCRITVEGMFGMLRGMISPKHISGPIFIFKEAARSANRGLEYVLEFMIFLSVSLAILNLLPIPILDGGHLLFFTIEKIKGSPLSLKTQQYANQFGMAILLLLMVFAFGNDILKLGS